MKDIAHWINASGLAEILSGPEWLTPLLQAIHILAISAVIGAALMIGLRMFGLRRMDTSLSETCDRMFPLLWYGVLSAAISGFVLVCGQPERELTNSLFQIKMVTVLAGIIATLLVQSRVRARVVGPVDSLGLSGKSAVVIVVAIWLCVLVLGRWIAYFE